MPKIVGLSGQSYTPLLPFSGSITTGGTAQLIRPISPGRVYLCVQNTSTGPLRLGIGGATATATISGGSISAITITNAGFGYTYPPQVILSGGAALTPLINGITAPDGVAGGYGFPEPTDQASASCTLSGGAVSAITITYGGTGYVAAPTVILVNDPRDPVGAFAPSATAGFFLAASSPPFVIESSTITTDQISIWGATTGQTFEYREGY